MTTKFHNVYEFAAALFDIDRHQGRSQAATVDVASKRLFRASTWGLGLTPLNAQGKREAQPNAPVWGVMIGGIVEGTDIEAGRTLMFPFSAEEFWNACEAVEEELDDARAEWDAQGDD